MLRQLVEPSARANIEKKTVHSSWREGGGGGQTIAPKAKAQVPRPLSLVTIPLSRAINSESEREWSVGKTKRRGEEGEAAFPIFTFRSIRLESSRKFTVSPAHLAAVHNSRNLMTSISITMAFGEDSRCRTFRTSSRISRGKRKAKERRKKLICEAAARSGET
jgi:hypothetical protein